MSEEFNAQQAITEECDAIKELLLRKNAKYGNSALEPLRVFSKADAVEQIKVRIDDKLSRILTSGSGIVDEDTVQDLIGYLVLLKIAEKKSKAKVESVIEDIEQVPKFEALEQSLPAVVIECTNGDSASPYHCTAVVKEGESTRGIRFVVDEVKDSLLCITRKGFPRPIPNKLSTLVEETYIFPTLKEVNFNEEKYIIYGLGKIDNGEWVFMTLGGSLLIMDEEYEEIFNPHT